MCLLISSDDLDEPLSLSSILKDKERFLIIGYSKLIPFSLVIISTAFNSSKDGLDLYVFIFGFSLDVSIFSWFSEFVSIFLVRYSRKLSMILL